MTSNSSKCLVSNDLIIQILLRLRVKSLIRFSCVCKDWYTLIKNPTFKNNHLHHPTNNLHLLVQHHDSKTDKFVFALFYDETISTPSYAYEDITDLKMPILPLAIVGPFDGIIFLIKRHADFMGLWNPATKEFRSVPLLHANYPPHLRTFMHVSGCGLDPITNEYKVVCIQSYWDDETDYTYHLHVVTVYTLGVDSWRLFEYKMDNDSILYNSLTNTYKNGYYYWLCDNGFDNYTILSYDMSTNNIKEGIHVPQKLWKFQVEYVTMYNDSLAMILFNPDLNQVEKFIFTWVMQEEGCWTTHLAIGPLFKIDRPIGILKTEELLLESDTDDLLLYNHNTQQTENIGMHGKDCCLQIYFYKESLLSVKRGNECKGGYNSSNLVGVQDFCKLSVDEENQMTEES